MVLLKRILTFVAVALTAATIPASAAKPRILILGDTHGRPHASWVSKLLKDQAEVVYKTTSSEEVYDTRTVLAKIDEWLGEEKWDLIYFNIGLSDLVYRAPGIESFRVMSREAGGVRNTSSEEYEKNLRELVSRLQATDAKLVWASTLPIGRSLLDVHEPGSEIEYNRIAAKVMTEAKIPIDDLHAYSLTLLSEKEQKGGVQPGQFNKNPLFSPMIDVICKELALNRPPDPPEFQKK